MAKSRSIKEANLNLYLNNAIVISSFVIVEIHCFDKIFDVAFKVAKDVENTVKVLASEVYKLVSSSALVKTDDLLKVRNEKFVVRKVPH